jgi:hypothetical protein
MLLAASRNRWTRYPKTRIIRKLIDNLGNRISLIWVPSHARISENEVADLAAKGALTEEIENRETYPPQDLIKWTNAVSDGQYGIREEKEADRLLPQDLRIRRSKKEICKKKKDFCK